MHSKDDIIPTLIWYSGQGGGEGGSLPLITMHIRTLRTYLSYKKNYN